MSKVGDQNRPEVPTINSSAPPAIEPSTDRTPVEQPPVRPAEQFISQFMARFGAGPPASIIDRATPEQLGKLIDLTETSDIRDDAFKTKLINRITLIAGGLILLIGFICWIFLHYQKADSLQQIITLLIGAGIGAGGGGTVGFGLGRTTRPRE